MTMPTSRNTTYIPQITEIKSADLNQLQDCVAGVTPHLLDDFFGALDASKWTESGDGSLVTAADGGGHLVNVLSGAAANDIHTLESAAELGSLMDRPQFRARVRFGIGLSLLTNAFHLIGFVRSDNGAIHLAFFRDTDDGETIQFEVRGASGGETVDTGITPDLGTWYVLEAAVSTDGSLAAWSISSAPNTTPLASGTVTPSGGITATNALRFHVECEALSGGQRGCGVDYISAACGRPT